MGHLLKNGLLIDPLNKIRGNYDILIEGNQIIKIAREITSQQHSVIDLTNKIVIPGLVDIHTHLREPGYEQKETIKSGAEAAAVGGFTKIACMPNTKPVIDHPAIAEFIKSKAKDAVVKVYPVGSITKNLAGKTLSAIGFLKSAGVRILSDDGKSVMNGEVMRRAMEYAASFDLTISAHCEDENLAGEGVMHEGYYSTILGLKPIPPAAEEVIIARDLLLADFTGCPLHIAHLSTKQGLEMVTAAKKKGVKVSCEVTPHHLLLTAKAVSSYNPQTKVNPPLRSKEDRQALVAGLKGGMIDVIATDHAPHTDEEKFCEYDRAAFGISGLETALALLYENFIKKDIISWEDLINLMVYNPAIILGVNVKGLVAGMIADLTVFDPEKKWTVDPRNFKSRGKNTPFAGERLSGKVLLTFVDGKIVYNDLEGKNEICY